MAEPEYNCIIGNILLKLYFEASGDNYTLFSYYSTILTADLLVDWTFQYLADSLWGEIRIEMVVDLILCWCFELVEDQHQQQ